MRRATLEFKCLWCNSPFKPWRKTSLYCKRACANASNGTAVTNLKKMRCRKCLKKLPRESFNRNDKSDRSKYHHTCRKCQKLETEARRKSKPWYFKNVTMMLSNAKIRAAKHGVPFSLKRSDIIVPLVCPVFGTPFKPQSDSQRSYFSRSMAMSLDRIVPAKGYVKDNVIVVSCRANSLKSDATPAELISLAAFYAQYDV